MSLTARRLRALLGLLALPALALLARLGGRGAEVDRLTTMLLGLAVTGLVFAIGLAALIGKLGDLARSLEDLLRRAVALWTPDPGATWLRWAETTLDAGRARDWIQRAAEEGSAEGRFELALAYLNGAWGPGGDAAALPLLEALSREGHPAAMAHLALAAFWGRGRTRDLAMALRWMRRAAEQGHGGAAAWLARAYTTGEGVEPDPREATRWQASATADPMPCIGLLARLRRPEASGAFETWLVESHHTVQEAYAAIFADPLLRRAFLGLAAFMLGGPLLVFLGILIIGWTANPIFFLPIPVCAVLAWTWRDGRAQLQRETRRTWAAAEAGDPEAYFRLGLAFERGDGDHPRDATAARIWFERAANAGHAEAAYRLGELLAWGQGGLKDVPKARRWLLQASEAGHAKARARLAELDLHVADADR